MLARFENERAKDWFCSERARFFSILFLENEQISFTITLITPQYIVQIMHELEKCSLFALPLVIFLVSFPANATALSSINSVQTSNSSSNQTQPVYVIGISFPQKSISAGDIVKIVFSVTGKGNFSEGTILIQSDYEMIMSNTLTIQGHVFPGGQWLNASGSDIGKQTLVAFSIGAFPYVGLNSIIGRINIDTSGMQPGKYQLRVMLLTEDGNGLNVFSDSTEFEIADFYASHQFMLWLITTVIAVTSLTTPLIYGLYKRRKSPEQTAKSNPKLKERGKTES
jgi:hypothetical protein